MKKDNKKNKGGRPLKFKSVEELQKKIDAYFKYCEDNKKPYTITGLAVYLDTTRDLLIDYQNKDEFSDAIKRSKQKIYAYAEESLFSGKAAAGVIFNMKNNYGWKDKTEVEHSADQTFKDLLSAVNK